MIYQRHEITSGMHTAPLFTYLLSNSEQIAPDRKRPLVLICPGGGYGFTSDREAEPVAVRLNAMGIHACILRYSVAPEARFPTALEQTAMSIALIREHAEEWHVDPDRIAVMGFSAGGHLACSMGTFWNRDFLRKATGLAPEEVKPNGLVLCYPVITSVEHYHGGSFENLLGPDAKNPEKRDAVSLEKQVGPDMPPTFIWHTYTDDAVPVENTLLLMTALRRHGIPMEGHIFPAGPHGISLGTEETTSPDDGGELTAYPELTCWIDMAGRWVKAL